MTKQEQMFALIEAAEQSTLTIAAFCAAHDLRMKTFFYWRKKLQAARCATPPGFVPITAPPSTGKADDQVSPKPDSIRLSYPNGVELHLLSADLNLIAQLIRLV